MPDPVTVTFPSRAAARAARNATVNVLHGWGRDLHHDPQKCVVCDSLRAAIFALDAALEAQP